MQSIDLVSKESEPEKNPDSGLVVELGEMVAKMVTMITYVSSLVARIHAAELVETPNPDPDPDPEPDPIEE